MSWYVITTIIIKINTHNKNMSEKVTSNGEDRIVTVRNWTPHRENVWGMEAKLHTFLI